MSGMSFGESGEGHGLPPVLPGPDGGTWGWGWVPVFGMLLTPGSSEFKEEVEKGFISKEIVPRRHRAAQRVSPPRSASLPMSPNPKAARMGGGVLF